MCCSSKAPVLLALQSLHLERSLARSSLPIPSFPSLPKAGSSSSSQEALVPATRTSNRRRTAVAEEGGGRRREEELTAKETQRDRDREKHTLDMLPH
jgi:hypothetical protein